MKCHILLCLPTMLFQSALTFAQVTDLGKSEKVANGLSIRYREVSDLCTEDDLSLLPPRIQMSLAGMGSDQQSRVEEFMKIVHEEVGVAVNASRAGTGSGTRKRILEVRLVDFREPNRTLNVATSLVGGAAIDPGRYRVELVLSKSDAKSEIAHAYIDSTPTVRGLLLGNAFSRQSSIRRNIRGQLKKLKVYWEQRQRQCIAREPK